MKKRRMLLACAMLGIAWLNAISSAPAFQDAKPGEEKKAEPQKKNTAIIPTPFNPKRHAEFVEIAKKGGIDVLLQGDSITDGWRSGGKAVYDKNFGPLKAANFGIGGDTTQGVLYRMDNGEMEGYTPKLMMLMIGTNNTGRNTPEEIAEGIKLIVTKFRDKFPQAKVLLLGVFPRSANKTDKARIATVDINKIISKYGDGKNVVYLDIGDKFLDKDGVIPVEIMKDRLHPTPKGYEIWAEAVMPTIREMLGLPREAPIPPANTEKK